MSETAEGWRKIGLGAMTIDQIKIGRRRQSDPV